MNCSLVTFALLAQPSHNKTVLTLIILLSNCAKWVTVALVDGTTILDIKFRICRREGETGTEQKNRLFRVNILLTKCSVI